MKTSRWLGVFYCSLVVALAGRAGAAEWNLVRFESREYVTLDNIAEFYGFPKPPPVDLTGHFAGPPVGAPAVMPAPVIPVVITPPSGPITSVEKITDEPSPITSQDPP